jgi:hypothetical protein
MYYSAQALRLRDLRVSYAAVLAAALFYVRVLPRKQKLSPL